MLFREVFRILSLCLWGLLLPLLIPTGYAIYCDWIAPQDSFPQLPCAHAFLLTMAIIALLALFFYWIGKRTRGQFYRKEALLLVLIVYFLTPLLGGIPFLFSGVLQNPMDAYFEVASGITTTGATILEAKRYDPDGKEIPYQFTFITGQQKDYLYYGTIKSIWDSKSQQFLTGIEAVHPALLFWRSMTQWLGGVGIIVLFITILPALGIGGKILFQAESTGPTKETMAPRIKETAGQIWKIYLGLTIAEIILLKITNQKITFMEAVTIAFSTISTGGFSVKNSSIASYNNPYTDWIIILFMVLGSINFLLYFYWIRGRFQRIQDSEFSVFLIIIIFTSLFVTWELWGIQLNPMDEPSDPLSFGNALRYGTFQIVSAISSTGFYSANFDVWPFSIQTTMLILMFVGGMAGSTAGGIKIVRQLIFFRILANKIETLFRPDAVRTFRIGTRPIGEQIAITVLCFILIVVLFATIGTFLLVLDGADPETSLTTIACMINNVGFSFRMGGPEHSFCFLSNFGKIISCIWMVAGRIEYFALLIAFAPAFWKKH